jgi:histidine phosphotransfer protein HptB
MVNWDRVAELRAEIGEDDLAEVVTLFLEESDEVALRLGQRLLTPNTGPALAADLHFLKGSALNLGFSALAARCQDGESLSGRGMDDTVDLAAILRLYTASKAAFLAGQTTQV